MTEGWSNDNKDIYIYIYIYIYKQGFITKATSNVG